MKQICLAPWKALSIKPNGDVAPDAQYKSIYGNLHKNSIGELLSSSEALQLKQNFQHGNFGASCESCRKKEQTLGHSRRIFFDHTLRRHFTEGPFVPHAEPDIWYLDLNLSNKCNLKCRMCNSISSTAWIADEKLLSKEKKHYHRPQENKSVKIELNKILEIFEDPKPFRNLKYLALRGGEPLLELENIRVLEKFVEWDLAKNITLDISTNGSVISKEILKLISSFSQTDLYISLEAVGDLYNYIRGGDKFNLNQLSENILQFRKAQNVTLMFAVTVSIYNIFQLDHLWDWFESIYQPYDEIIMTNAVVRPDYLNFQILPREMKNQALRRLEASRILEGPHHTGRRLVGDSGKILIRSSLQKEIFTPLKKRELLLQFTEFNNDLDKIRGTCLADVAPELMPLFDKMRLDAMLEKEG